MFTARVDMLLSSFVIEVDVLLNASLITPTSSATFFMNEVVFEVLAFSKLPNDASSLLRCFRLLTDLDNFSSISDSTFASASLMIVLGFDLLILLLFLFV